MKLSQDQILTAAFDLLEKDGLDAFSMRKLAPTLSVQAPALYWHVGGKAELFGMMATIIYAEARAAIPATVDWPGWLAAYGQALRRAILKRRDAARLFATAHPAIADGGDTAARITAPLVALGLNQARALSYQSSVISFALGWSLYAQSGPMHQYLNDLLDFDAAFNTGLEAMIHGFKAHETGIWAGDRAPV